MRRDVHWPGVQAVSFVVLPQRYRLAARQTAESADWPGASCHGPRCLQGVQYGESESTWELCV